MPPLEPAAPELIRAGRSFHRIQPGLHCITLPVPFAGDPVNTYVLEGPPLTLVDTGAANTPGSLELLESGFASLGRRLEDVELLVITHAHLDHFGLAAEIRRRSGCRVMCHARDLPVITAFEAAMESQTSDLLQAHRALGFPAAAAEYIRPHFASILAGAESVAVDGTLEDGDELAIGDRAWSILHCPGHSGGLICLYDRAGRTLLANDHLLRYITPNPTVYRFSPPDLSSGLPEYVQSLERVRHLPVDLALTGHGPEITHYGERISEVLHHHQQRSAEVLECTRHEALSVARLIDKVWGRLGSTNTYLAAREILGHLVLLEGTGQVVREQDGGEVLRFSAVG